MGTFPLQANRWATQLVPPRAFPCLAPTSEPLVTPLYPVPLPPTAEIPSECWDLLTHLDATSGVPASLDLVLGQAQTVVAIVDGTPTLALLQDVLRPDDLLAQAIREAGIPSHQTSEDVPGLPRNPYPTDTLPPDDAASDDFASEPSSTDSEMTIPPEHDSLEDAAIRILRWLKAHDPFPPPDDQE